MTNRQQALRHYQQAIRALSQETHSNLTDAERGRLLQLLHTEKRRLIRSLLTFDEESMSADSKNQP